MTKYTYIYQLKNADFKYLYNLDFKIGVVDVDDTKLTAEDISFLKSDGKILFSYLSIGEAEDYRDYWSNWKKKPNYVLSENPRWEGNYYVKYWNPDWQNIILNKLSYIQELGYSGVYLDIVDGYLNPEVTESYEGNSNPREEMINFIKLISNEAKSIDKNFKIIPQNAPGLLSIKDNINLDEVLPNYEYLKLIDGIGKEDSFTKDNDSIDWTEFDLHHLKNATNNNKFVLAVDYPTKESLKLEFIDKAINEGFIPFVGNRELDRVDPINSIVSEKINPDIMSSSITIWPFVLGVLVLIILIRKWI